MTVCPQDRRFEAVNLRGNVHEMVDLSENRVRRTARFVFPDAAIPALFRRPHFQVGATLPQAVIEGQR
jgi:hypothetical protein